MPKPLPISIGMADAVVAVLVADEGFAARWAEAGADMVPVRALRRSLELQDMDVLHVTAVPQSVARERASRKLVQEDYRVNLVIQKRFAQEGGEGEEAVGDVEVQAADQMILAQDLADFFLGKALTITGGPMGAVIRSDIETLYVPEHWDQWRQFTGVVTLTIRVFR
jgi:hypothetical protein